MHAAVFGGVDELTALVDEELVETATKFNVEPDEQEQILVAVVVDIGPDRAVAITIGNCALLVGGEPIELVLEGSVSLVHIQAWRRAESVTRVVVDEHVEKAVVVYVAPRDAIARTLVDKTVTVVVDPCGPQSIVAFVDHIRKLVGDVGERNGGRLCCRDIDARTRRGRDEEDSHHCNGYRRTDTSPKPHHYQSSSARVGAVDLGRKAPIRTRRGAFSEIGAIRAHYPRRMT